MSQQNQLKFRIEIKDSRYRRIVLFGILILFLTSVWLWQEQVIQYQILIQLLLSLVLLAWFGTQIFKKIEDDVLLLSESGVISWLQPLDETPWEVAANSRFNGWVHWLVLKNRLMQKQKRLVLFRDSVSDANWRHLCRVVNKCLTKTGSAGN